jgi:hypothetical protein
MSRRKKEKAVQISSEEIQSHIDNFLKEGGEIEKIETGITGVKVLEKGFYQKHNQAKTEKVEKNEN